MVWQWLASFKYNCGDLPISSSLTGIAGIHRKILFLSCFHFNWIFCHIEKCNNEKIWLFGIEEHIWINTITYYFFIKNTWANHNSPLTRSYIVKVKSPSTIHVPEPTRTNRSVLSLCLVRSEQPDVLVFANTSYENHFWGKWNQQQFAFHQMATGC